MTSKDWHGAPDTTNYDSYAQIKKVAADAASRVANKNMPPSTADETMTTAERATFEQWVACGLKP